MPLTRDPLTTLPTPAVGHPTMDALLATLIERTRAHPQGVALIEPGGSWHRWLGRPRRRITQGELGQRIAAASARLRQLGLGEGDAVLYAVRPGVNAMALLSALFSAGPTVIGLDAGIGDALLAERLKPFAPGWVVAESIVFAAGAPGLLRAWLRRHGLVVPDIALPGARFVRVGAAWLPGVPQSIPSESLWRDAPASLPVPALRADRAVLAIFTSGTTAAPKTVLHTSASLGAACTIIGRRMALSSADVVYSNQTHQMLAAVLAGAPCVVPASRTDARRFIDDIARYRVTHAYAVPFELAGVVDRLERQGQRLPAHLRVIVLGSAPVRPTFLRRLRAVCAPATDVWCAYGMSEMFPVALVESREKLAFEGEGDLVGTPVEGAQIELADDGELSVAGPNLFAGYVGLPPVTLHATGDLARLDARGRLVLLGRKKDMIIRGHHNIYPSLYEDTIAALPGVEACAMVGRPSADQTDEQLVLVIEPRAEGDGPALCQRVQQALADGSCAIDTFARPDHVLVGRLPRSGRSNKLDRRQLAAWAEAELARHGR
jgi:long-chain acyl-CoA synthetase